MADYHERVRNAWDKFVETFGPLRALEQDIFKHLYLRPSYILLPVKFLEGKEPPEEAPLSLFGIPVIWTDTLVKPSLVYTPPNPYEKKEI